MDENLRALTRRRGEVEWGNMSMQADDQIAVLFDWDGVIIDSSRPHEESWERLAS